MKKDLPTLVLEREEYSCEKNGFIYVVHGNLKRGSWTVRRRPSEFIQRETFFVNCIKRFL